VDLDLQHERLLTDSRVPLLRPLEGLVGERPVVEAVDLVTLAGGTLHALANAGLDRVDHWEVEPGGWLPLPERPHAGDREPVAHLRRAVRSRAWERIASAHTFAVRLADRRNRRADVTVRRRHRERSHSISLGLYGGWTEAEVRNLLRSLRGDLPVLHARVRERARAG
jgi:hypothetical protein